MALYICATKEERLLVRQISGFLIPSHPSILCSVGRASSASRSFSRKRLHADRPDQWFKNTARRAKSGW
jgi:hypothetical protein